VAIKTGQATFAERVSCPASFYRRLLMEKVIAKVKEFTGEVE